MNQTKVAMLLASMKASTLPDPGVPHKLKPEGRQTVAQGGGPTVQKVTVSTAFLSTSTSRFSHSHSIFSLTLPFCHSHFYSLLYPYFLTFSLFLLFFFKSFIYNHSFLLCFLFLKNSSLHNISKFLLEIHVRKHS